MEGVKFGKSTIVLNGECKEIETRSLAVSTEDLHKFSTSKCQHNQQPFYCLAPLYLGNNVPYFGCPCQRQYFLWQNLMVNSEHCYCRNNMQNIQNWNNVPRCNQFIPVNSTMFSPQSNQSGHEELMRLDLNKPDSGSEIPVVETNEIMNRNKIVGDMQISCESNCSINNQSISDLNGKSSKSRIPKINSKLEMDDSLKEDDPLSPKELINYANEFLSCPKFMKKEENVTSDEDLGDKSYVSRTISDRTFCSDKSGKTLCVKNLDNAFQQRSKYNEKFVVRNSGDCNVISKIGDGNSLSHLLKPGLSCGDETDGYEEKTIPEKHPRLINNKNSVQSKNASQPVKKSSNRIPVRPSTATSEQSMKGEQVPMMLMINSLVKKHPPASDSKLNQLLTHIEKEEQSSNDTTSHRFRKRSSIQRKASGSEHLKK